jgi:hypothetical protein
MSSTVVRKAMRYDVSIRAALRIAPTHGDVVRLSSGAAGQGGWVEVDCVDASMGGMGFISTVFLPRMTQVTARLFGADPTQVVLECPCVIRRVIMTDRRPAYHLGCSFGDLSPELQRLIESLLNNLGSEE